MSGINSLQAALTLIEEAKTNMDFTSKYTDNLFAMGESQKDYAAYHFDLSDEYYLILDFTDFSLVDFSIVCRGHEEIITREQG